MIEFLVSLWIYAMGVATGALVMRMRQRRKIRTRVEIWRGCPDNQRVIHYLEAIKDL